MLVAAPSGARAPSARRSGGSAANVRRRNGPGGSAAKNGRPGETITPAAAARCGELAVVGAGRERDPQVHAALGQHATAGKCAAQRVAALAQHAPQPAQVRRARPGVPTSSSAASWSGPATNRSSTIRAARRRAAAGPRAVDAGDPQAGRRRLGERADVHDVAVGVVARTAAAAPGRSAVSRNASSSTMNAPAARTASSTAARRSGDERRAVRVREQRLQVDEPRAGRLERVGQQIGPDAALVDGHRHRLQALRAGRGERADVRRRLDDHRCARRGEPAQAGGEGGLAARADQHVAGRRADRGGEVRAQPARAPPAARGPRRRAAAPARASAAPERRGRLEVGRQVAGREHERARRRQSQQRLERVGVDRARAERDRLP